MTLERRNVKNSGQGGRPEQLEEILNAAKDVSSSELKDLFGKLMSAALDPQRQHTYRSDFVGIVQKMEPIDALILPQLKKEHRVAGISVNETISRNLKFSPDQIAVSVANLIHIGVVAARPGHEQDAHLTPLGRLFLNAIED